MCPGHIKFGTCCLTIITCCLVKDNVIFDFFSAFRLLQNFINLLMSQAFSSSLLASIPLLYITIVWVFISKSRQSQDIAKGWSFDFKANQVIETETPFSNATLPELVTHFFRALISNRATCFFMDVGFSLKCYIFLEYLEDNRLDELNWAKEEERWHLN
jgi:hypothetical protein